MQFSESVSTVVTLDGKTISVPYDFRALEMVAGEHTIQITARDQVGNSAQKEFILLHRKNLQVLRKMYHRKME